MQDSKVLELNKGREEYEEQVIIAPYLASLKAVSKTLEKVIADYNAINNQINTIMAKMRSGQLELPLEKTNGKIK